MKQVLRRTPPSLQRIDVLLALAESLGHDSLYALDAIRLSDSLKEKSRLKDGLNILGESYVVHQRFDAAERCFQRSLGTPAELRNDRQKARSVLGLGLVLHGRNMAREARERFEESLRIAEAIRDTAGMARVLYRIGVLCMNQRDFPELLGEAVDLSYHSARTRFPDFSVTIETSYDPGIGAVSIMPQEISRVFLNLLGNAMDAVEERRTAAPDTYRPTVRVRTARVGKRIEISVADNGAGVTQDMLDKMFQPFFTTKIATHGTGLGLSISHDIVVKGHGGSLSCSRLEEGTELLVSLPG